MQKYFSALGKEQRVYWNDFPDKDKELNYQVAIKLVESPEMRALTFLGVLLNDRYVLSVFEIITHS